MGRSRKKKLGKDETGTTHVRVSDDIAEMIRWVRKVEDKTQSGLLDPILRPVLLAKSEKYKDLIEELKANAMVAGIEPKPRRKA